MTVCVYLTKFYTTPLPVPICHVSAYGDVLARILSVLHM